MCFGWARLLPVYSSRLHKAGQIRKGLSEEIIGEWEMAVATKVAVVSIKVSDLRDALANGMLVDQRTLIPVHSCSKLDVVGGKATLTSCDTEKTIKVSFDATGPDMSCLMPRRRALKFLSGGDSAVMVEPTSKGVILTREGLGKVSLTASGKIEDFPKNEVPSGLKWAKLDAKWFLKMLRHALICVATDESWPVLTAVMCEEGKMAAADGFRLAVVTSDKLKFGLGTRLVSQSADKGGGMAEVKNQSLLPRDIAMVAIRAFAKEESIEFAVGKGPNNFNFNDMILIRGGNTLIMGQAGMGNYPAIDQLIPQSFDSRVTFSVPLMLQRINMMDLRDGSGILRLHFHKTDKSEDVGDLSGRAEEEHEYAMQMPVKLENGKDGRVAFNWKYLMEAIKPFSVCTLDLTSPSSPGKFTGDIKELSYTIMPMFFQW